MFFFLSLSYSLCATTDRHGLHRKCSLCCHGDSLLDFLGDRAGVWERAGGLRLDQVCRLLKAFRWCCFISIMSPLQVRPRRDAVCCLLGEQLLRHVALHPLCLLPLYLPPLRPHLLLLSSTECQQLPLHLEQVVRGDFF